MEVRAAILCIALASGSLVACSLLLDDSFSSGNADGGNAPDAQTDVASNADTSIASDAGEGDGPVTPIDAASDGGVIFREDFETGCGAWVIDDVVLTSVPGHTGMGCRMCTTVSTASSIGIEKNLSGVDAGESFIAEAWFSRPVAAGPDELYMSLESEISGGNAKGFVNTTFADGWQKITVEHTTVPMLSYLVLRLGGEIAVQGECIDIDEVVVTKK